MQEAIENMTKLAEFKPMWIEEPTNCDDVIGHVSAPPVPQLPPSVLSTAGSRKTRIQ
jgi:L-fuconate dehydratase